MKLFENPPSRGQFALNGQWENALSFNAYNPPSTDEIKTYLAGRNELAFEMFFDDLFFGMRFFGSPALILELSQNSLNCVKTSRDARSFIKAVGYHVLSIELCREVTHIEVGAVNAWQSIGSYLLPPPAQAFAHFDELWSDICTTELANDIKHPKAVEMAYGEPLPHWIGFPISNQQPPYHLNKDMFREVLQTY
jgi:hypothetical protein